MSGAGIISCYDCNYSENIISFFHNFNLHGEISDTHTSLQCQSCGKFHTIKDWNSNKQILCDCKGILEREKPLFCPKCRSKSMKYNTLYMT